MAYETKENEFSLFKNKEKEGNQPDMTGKVMVNGKLMRIAAWKKGEDDNWFLSGKISEFKSKVTNNNNQAQDDLPF